MIYQNNDSRSKFVLMIFVLSEGLKHEQIQQNLKLTKVSFLVKKRVFLEQR